MAAFSRAPDPPAAVIGIGASAGGVEALTKLVAGFAPDLQAAVLVVLHVPVDATSFLSEILNRAGPLTAAAAIDGEPVVAGRIYTAPPDRHLLVADGHIKLSRGPRSNGHRPAVDPTFASLARSYGAGAVGVLLSGTLDDGSRGMFEIKAAGGTTLVQDPAEARHPGMIESAQRLAEIDAVLPLTALSDRLNQLAREQEPVTSPGEPDLIADAESATRYTCPDCGGVLWRRQQGPSLRFVCSVGHAYSPESLRSAQGDAVEASLWAAARILGDRRALLAEMAVHAESHDRPIGARRYLQAAAEAEDAAAAVRSLIVGDHIDHSHAADQPPEGE